MSQPQYSDYASIFKRAGIEYPPAEVHGLLTGYLCVLPGTQPKSLRSRYAELLGIPGLSDESITQMDELLANTLDELDEFGDFQFRILMPDDSHSLDDRSRAVQSFCTGFLSGFGLAGGVHDETLAGEIGEAISDFGTIAGLRETVEDSEENETDLTEIIEYVRISVLLIFAEYSGTET